MQGHIHKRVHSAADGRTTTTWYVIVDAGRDRNGKRRQKWHGGYRTRREAEAVRAKIVNEMHRGDYVAPTKTTLDDWVETWLIFAKSSLKATTWVSYKRNLELYVLPTLGVMPLSDITPTALNQLYATLLESGRVRAAGGGLSPRTVRYVHAIVRKVLNDSIDAGLLAVNPAVRAKPPRTARSAAPTMNFWSADELARFLDHVKGHKLEVAFHLLAYTGMRRGEVAGLRWQDVDLDAGRLAVRHTFVVVAKEVRNEVPKSHQARVVDLDSGTVERLRTLAASWPTRSHTDTVVCEPDGAPVHPDRLTGAFGQLVRESGLRRIRLHDLRHTHATLALRAGVPVKVISERLGHERPAFTLSQYTHVMPGMQAEAAERIANLLREAR
ncbi:MAG: tyrosine-type recombinase/integrase [Acidimicrobiales bacterium]